MSARQEAASVTKSVQTLLINLKFGPLQQPTELLKLSSEGEKVM